MLKLTIKNLDEVRFVKVNSLPVVREHLTPKLHVYKAISHSVDESSLSRFHPQEKINLHEQDSITLSSSLTSPKKMIYLPYKSFVDSLHEHNRSRRDLSSLYNNQDDEFDNNEWTNLNSITVNRNPSLDHDLAMKKYIDDEWDKNTVLRFMQTLDKYLKVSNGNDACN